MKLHEPVSLGYPQVMCSLKEQFLGSSVIFVPCIFKSFIASNGALYHRPILLVQGCVNRREKNDRRKKGQNDILVFIGPSVAERTCDAFSFNDKRQKNTIISKGAGFERAL
jgi:hypothetical protein